METLLIDARVLVSLTVVKKTPRGSCCSLGPMLNRGVQRRTETAWGDQIQWNKPSINTKY